MSMQEEFTDYLARLLGRTVAIHETLTLTSGQQARAAGWLAERGFAPEQLRAQLSVPFTPSRLLGGTTAPAARDCALPRQRRSEQTRALQRVGIDIQRVDEVIPSDALSDLKSSAELTAIFTLREISYAQSRPSPSETLCGLFCAKEALRKCDAALLTVPLTEIEILPDEDGEPRFEGYSLSISHSGGFAIAVALRAARLDSPRPPPAPSTQVVGVSVPRAAAALLSDPVASDQAKLPTHADPQIQRTGQPGGAIRDVPRRGIRARATAWFENLLRWAL